MVVENPELADVMDVSNEVELPPLVKTSQSVFDVTTNSLVSPLISKSNDVGDTLTFAANADWVCVILLCCIKFEPVISKFNSACLAPLVFAPWVKVNLYLLVLPRLVTVGEDNVNPLPFTEPKTSKGFVTVTSWVNVVVVAAIVCEFDGVNDISTGFPLCETIKVA